MYVRVYRGPPTCMAGFLQINRGTVSVYAHPIQQKWSTDAPAEDGCMVVDGVLDDVGAMNICERDQELVHKFEELSQLHEKNMMSGHQRQVPYQRDD